MFGRGSRLCRRQSIQIVCLILFLYGIWGKFSEVAAEEQTQTPVSIEYFGYNTCAACAPEEEFYALVREQIGDLRQQIPYTIFEYNTFHQEDKEKLTERRKELDIPDNNGVWPVVIVKDRYFIGLEEGKEQLRELLLAAGEREDQEEKEEVSGVQETDGQSDPSAEAGENLVRQQLGTVSEEDSVILYFSTLSCKDCQRVKELLKALGEEILLSNGEVSSIKVCEISIAEEEQVPFLWQLFETYKVPEKEQMVPILFYQGGYLSGADAAAQNLEQELKDGKMQNFSFDVLEQEKGAGPDVTGKLAMALTGFVNGLNPCGASMLLMLLAACVMLGKGVWKPGLAYHAGKFLAYFCMGLGLYQLFLQLDTGILSSISQMISRIAAVLFLLLAVLYLIDFWNVKKKDYGKIRMQLPEGLRKWNRERIEKAAGISGRKLLPAVFLLGIVISAGEFFCTGQVYLAAILYLMKEQAGNADIVLTFLIYITAMCIPGLILVGVIEKTGNVIRASNRTLEWMPVIKLLTAAVFFVAAVFMLLQA